MGKGEAKAVGTCSICKENFQANGNEKVIRMPSCRKEFMHRECYKKCKTNLKRCPSPSCRQPVDFQAPALTLREQAFKKQLQQMREKLNKPWTQKDRKIWFSKLNAALATSNMENTRLRQATSSMNTTFKNKIQQI